MALSDQARPAAGKGRACVLAALRASPVPTSQESQSATLRPRSSVSRLAYWKEAMTDKPLRAMSPQQMTRS